jgi:hypothetical protein
MVSHLTRAGAVRRVKAARACDPLPVSTGAR